ncbi:uncharacterized protein LOC135714806 [Ochlerotatus camptorhynchus]|uniref:uncharacterized protein LOC135714806 n=1 Tax=Ochlerotatus camptorhynchus TaxID=644619 RepID=UPI0031E3FB16
MTGVGRREEQTPPHGCQFGSPPLAKVHWYGDKSWRIPPPKIESRINSRFKAGDSFAALRRTVAGLPNPCPHIHGRITFPSRGRNWTERAAAQTPTNLDGLLNVSLLDSIVSGPANSLNAHNMEDQSPRLRDNRDAIEKHRNIRCQMLDNTSSIGSNKENVKPPSISDVRVEVQDVQRLRVFETLQQDCQRQQTRLSRSSRRNSPDKCNQKNEPVNPRLNDGKKRKLFAKQAEPDNMNFSNDSQIQRSKYVDRKLVNTVKPIQTLDVKPLKLIQNIAEERIDLLSEPSTSEMMSNDEFDRSLQAFIDHLHTKLEKNIRKINQMVERTTKKFFKREPAPENLLNSIREVNYLKLFILLLAIHQRTVIWK